MFTAQAMRMTAPAHPMRRGAFLGGLAAVLICSFLFTLWITAPETVPDAAVTDNRPPAVRLASRRVSSVVDLIDAARAVGVTFSPRMKGNINSIRRLSDRDVSIEGWLADLDGDATPITILVFQSGSVTFAQTKGERQDVTASIGLGLGAEKNVSFQATFNCKVGERPLVIGLGKDRRYTRLTAPKCP